MICLQGPLRMIPLGGGCNFLIFGAYYITLVGIGRLGGFSYILFPADIHMVNIFPQCFIIFSYTYFITVPFIMCRSYVFYSLCNQGLYFKYLIPSMRHIGGLEGTPIKPPHFKALPCIVLIVTQTQPLTSVFHSISMLVSGCFLWFLLCFFASWVNFNIGLGQ